MKKINRKKHTLKRAHDYERRVSCLVKGSVVTPLSNDPPKLEIRLCNGLIVHFDGRLLEWVDE